MNEAHNILMQLRQAKEEVKRLDAAYRKVCECNDKISGVKFEPQSYQKMYKTCKYHEVTFHRETRPKHHARV
jgi:hypothetical protein